MPPNLPKSVHLDSGDVERTAYHLPYIMDDCPVKGRRKHTQPHMIPKESSLDHDIAGAFAHFRLGSKLSSVDIRLFSVCRGAQEADANEIERRSKSVESAAGSPFLQRRLDKYDVADLKCEAIELGHRRLRLQAFGGIVKRGEGVELPAFNGQ